MELRYVLQNSLADELYLWSSIDRSKSSRSHRSSRRLSCTANMLDHNPQPCLPSPNHFVKQQPLSFREGLPPSPPTQPQP